jgi:hypothetical protein
MFGATLGPIGSGFREIPPMIPSGEPLCCSLGSRQSGRSHDSANDVFFFFLKQQNLRVEWVKVGMLHVFCWWILRSNDIFLWFMKFIIHEVSDDHRKMAELKMGIPIKW